MKHLLLSFFLLLAIPTFAQTDILSYFNASAQLYSGWSYVFVGADNISGSSAVPFGFRLTVGPNLVHKSDIVHVSLGLDFASMPSPTGFIYYDEFSNTKRLIEKQKESYFGWLLKIDLISGGYFIFGNGRTYSTKDITLANGSAYQSDDMGKAKTYSITFGKKWELLHRVFAPINSRVYITGEGYYSFHAYPAKYYPVTNDNTSDNISFNTLGINIGLLFNYMQCENKSKNKNNYNSNRHYR